MKTIVFIMFLFGLTVLSNAQTIALQETVIELNNTYLNAVNADNAAECVKILEEKVVNYNRELTPLYNEVYDTYKVSFYIPEGKIIAVYNTDGKIIRTIEKYNNVRLPLIVMQAIAKRFPNWGIISDAYHINYHCEKDTVKQEYKIKIKNENEIITVKTNETGMFL
ncbi:nicotinate-nucleotide adenylyltransferase [Thalassobellus suaedae]|uniref:Nicotinate-nucleotide adenylyltransferase n=1 Tax=Thalassobellus suaedae TaxID=3074124 RepID=A0ABY9Y2T9_9FLAO|nr:nicotinate-nucleotide adenylyltransferase [Flavobacteriaceae bacterium HL-DH10]